MNATAIPTHTSSHPVFEKTASAGRSVVLLVIRLAWGFYMFLSGSGHLAHIAKTADFFKDLGIPMPCLNAYVSGYTEMVGGIMLFAGLFSRLISVPLVINFLVALFLGAHDKVKMIFTNPGDSGSWTKVIDDDAFPFLIASLVILAFGPGKASLDYLLQRTVFKNRCSARHLVLEAKPPLMPDRHA